MATLATIREASPDKFKIKTSRKNLELLAYGMAASFLREGQQKPIIVDENDYVIDGRIRHRAAELIRKGFRIGRRSYGPDPEFKLMFIYQRQ